MSDPFGPVVITTRDIYDALVRLQETVSRLVDQGVGHADDIRDHEARLRAVEDVRPGPRLAKVETEVDALKGRQWPLPTVAVLLSAAALGTALIPRLLP